MSDFQGVVDWLQVRDHVGFAYVQIAYASPSHLVVPARARVNVEGAARAGLLVGAYMYGDPGGPPAHEQGAFAADTLRKIGVDTGLPLVLDIEVNPSGHGPTAFADWVEAWLRGTGLDAHRLAIYSNPGFWNASTDGRLVNAHLWVAAWGAPRPPGLRGLPDPFCWQHSDRGHVPGTAGPVDMDVLLFRPAS